MEPVLHFVSEEGMDQGAFILSGNHSLTCGSISRHMKGVEVTAQVVRSTYEGDAYL